MDVLMNKIVVFQNGQQVISEVSVISREDNGERVGYLLNEPRVILYYEEEGEVKVRLVPFVLAAVNPAYEVRIEDVLTFGDPHPSLEETYVNETKPETSEVEEVELELQADEESGEEE
jgi:hypothetical protein